MEIDPVCGMEVDPKNAAATYEYEGKMYYFCAPGCKAAFEKDPEKYLQHDHGATSITATTTKTKQSHARQRARGAVISRLAGGRFRTPMDPHPYDSPPSATKPPAAVPLRIGFISILTFLIGLGGGYLLWGRTPAQAEQVDAAAQTEAQLAVLIREINPPEGYTLSVSYGDLGPQLLAAGAIDYALFLRIYEQKGLPLTEAQQAILTTGSRDTIVLNRQNANFLLNFFWAVGLVNQNLILLDGPMQKYGEGEVGRFASTGGWTIGMKDPVELYASQPLIQLTAAQQARLEKVAAQVYRPCCNNPTHFPDCNHGMAMLGLLTLLASEDVSEAEMFAAAKYANAFWFPQQTLELAMFFQASQDMAYAAVDPQIAVGQNFSSGQGYQNVHNWLAGQDLLDPAPTGGGSCGV